MRILIFDRWAGGRDGPGVYVRELAKGLLENGHTPHLVYDQSRGSDSVPGLTTSPVAGLSSRTPSAKAIAQIESLADSFRPDLQVVECLDVPWFASSVAAHGPLLLSLHTHSYTCPNWTRVLWRSGDLCVRDFSPECALQHYWGGCGAGGGLRTLVSNLSRCFQARRTLRYFAAIHVPSQYVGSTLVRAGIEARRVLVLQYPAPLLEEGAAPAQVDPESDRILFVGRLDREKGAQALLEACGRLTVPFRLRLVGAAALDDRAEPIERLLDRSGLAGRCELRPSTHRHADLSEHYAAAAVVAVPSLWGDPSPLVRLEAMAHGRPVVGFDSGGVASAVQHGITGLVVPRGDVAALAGALDSLLRNPTTARQMGRAGRRLVESTLTPRQHAGALLAGVAGLSLGQVS